MRFLSFILLGLSLAGCASNVVYNPMEVATQQEILLNEDGFKAVQNGMSIEQVHKIMGPELVIGYVLEAPQSSDYKPLTVPNPYKSEAGQDKNYFIEYYIDAITQPDGIIHDNELTPLIFKNGTLVGRGWPLANTLRPAHSPA